MFVRVPAVLFPIQLPTRASGKAEENGLNAWVLAAYMGDPIGVLGSWLWLGPVPVIVAI